ncbi:MAG: hypothetical protein II333_13080 [Clostridia bacterium]|nr:hypothetical protein [Clostridia bacterium]
MKSRIVAAITAAAALTAAIAIIPVMAENDTKTETEFAVAAEPAAEALGNITIESKSIDTSVGTVSVNVNITKNPGVVTMTIPVTWDNTVLKLTGITEMYTVLTKNDNCTGWLGYTDYEYAQSNGVYYLAWDNDLAAQDFEGTGTLCTMQFEILNENFDSTKIGIEMKESEKILPISNIMNYDMEDLQASFEFEGGTLTSGGTVADTVTVKGTVNSFGTDPDVETTIELFRVENGVVSTTAAKTVTVTGYESAYEISGVAPGDYVLKVSKPNHVSRSYQITVNKQ